MIGYSSPVSAPSLPMKGEIVREARTGGNGPPYTLYIDEPPPITGQISNKHIIRDYP